jgi:hypothetical protein
MGYQTVQTQIQKAHQQLVELQAFSIPHFCLRNGISISTYHKLKKEGRGPREMCLGSAIRISVEAERDWRKEREMPNDAEAPLDCA